MASYKKTNSIRSDHRTHLVEGMDQVTLKEITPGTRKKVHAYHLESRQRELQLKNSVGTSSIPERHYPKVIILKKGT